MRIREMSGNEEILSEAKRVLDERFTFDKVQFAPHGAELFGLFHGLAIRATQGSGSFWSTGLVWLRVEEGRLPPEKVYRDFLGDYLCHHQEILLMARDRKGYWKFRWIE